MKSNWIVKYSGGICFLAIYFFGALWIIFGHIDDTFRLAMLSGILFFSICLFAQIVEPILKYIKNTTAYKTFHGDEKDEKIHLNKSPNELKKVLLMILKPEKKDQEKQIDVFISNIFKWDSKFGSLSNSGTSLNFLNRKSVKLLSGFLYYIINNKKITSHETVPNKRQIEKILINELQNSNSPNIGLSEDGLRKKLDANLELFKESILTSSNVAQYELFQ